MNSHEAAPVVAEIQQLSTDHLRSVELNETAYKCLGKIVLQNPEISLDTFEGHYNSVFPGATAKDPDHGYKVTAAFEQLQAEGVIALGANDITESKPRRWGRDKHPGKTVGPENLTFAVSGHTPPTSLRQNKKAFYKASKDARRDAKAKARAEGKPFGQGSGEITWSKVAFGNRKVQQSRNRSAAMGARLKDLTTPNSADSAAVKAAKSVARTIGKDSIYEHNKRLKDRADKEIKRQIGIAKRSHSAPSPAITEATPASRQTVRISPEVAEWAKERVTVARSDGGGGEKIEVNDANQLSLKAVKESLFTQDQVEVTICRAHDAYMEAIRGSGMTPEAARDVRKTVIRAEAEKAILEVAGNTRVPASLLNSFVDLIAQHYSGQIGQNAIRDHEQTKQDLLST